MTFFIKRAWRKVTGKGKAKKKEKAEKKKYRKYMKKARKGKTIKAKSPYSKPQRKLVDWLAKTAKGELPAQLDIKKDPAYQRGTSKLQALLSGDPAATAAFEAPVRREFREQIMPELAEQYAGAGAGRSSAFSTAAAGAGATLAEQLAAMREQLAVGVLPQALQYAEQPIQNRAGLMERVIGAQPSQLYNIPYMSDYQPGKTHGGMIGGTIGAIGGGLLGGPLGAAAGWAGGQALGGAATDVGGSEGNYGAGMQGLSSALGAGIGRRAGGSLMDLLGGGSRGVPAASAFPSQMMETTPFASTMAVS